VDSRKTLVAGLEFYTKDCWSNTVSVVRVPVDTTFEDINRELLDNYNLMIAGAFGCLDGKLFRIGRMVEGCYKSKLIYTLKCSGKKLGVRDLNSPR